MRKFTAALGAVALFAIMPAAPAKAEGAVITPDGACGGFVPTETGEQGDALTGEISLSNKTKSGNLNITCKFNVPAELIPSKVRKANGFPCGFPDGTIATETRMIVTPGGSGSLSCKRRGS